MTPNPRAKDVAQDRARLCGIEVLRLATGAAKILRGGHG